MSTLTETLTYIFTQRAQRVNFSAGDDLKTVRYDAPLPEGFKPPTQEEVDVALAYLADPVPENVTAPQMMRALYAKGAPITYDQVDAITLQAGGLMRALWLHAAVFTRADPLIDALGATLKLTKRQVDDLFRAAGKYP